jgi:hypothetical protein
MAILAAVLACAAAPAVARAEGDALRIFPEATARAEGFIGQTFVQGFAPAPATGQPAGARSIITHLGHTWAEGESHYSTPTENAPASYELLYNWTCPDGGVYEVAMTFPDGASLATQLTIPAHPCRTRWHIRVLHARVGHRPEAQITDTWSKDRPYRANGEHERMCVSTGGSRHCASYAGGARHSARLPSPKRAGQLYVLTLAETGDPGEVQRYSVRAGG